MASYATPRSTSQGRALAITNSLFSLTTHTLLFLFAALHASSSSSSSLQVASWFSLYNLLAAGASFAGVIGAIWTNPKIISIYTISHAITLLVLTLSLLQFLIFGLPNPRTTLPFRWFDERNFCQELHDFGGDEELIARCDARLAIVENVIGCFLAAALAAQWWALVSVRRWAKDLGEGDRGVGRGERMMDVENMKSKEEWIEG